jgi:hypothetical protein
MSHPLSASTMDHSRLHGLCWACCRLRICCRYLPLCCRPFCKAALLGCWTWRSTTSASFGWPWAGWCCLYAVCCFGTAVADSCCRSRSRCRLGLHMICLSRLYVSQLCWPDTDISHVCNTSRTCPSGLSSWVCWPVLSPVQREVHKTAAVMMRLPRKKGFNETQILDWNSHVFKT